MVDRVDCVPGDLDCARADGEKGELYALWLGEMHGDDILEEDSSTGSLCGLVLLETGVSAGDRDIDLVPVEG